MREYVMMSSKHVMNDVIIHQQMMKYDITH